MARNKETVKNIYTERFYEKQSHNSYAAANIILPLLFRFYQPKSTVDLGCGTGSWLKAAIENGVKKIQGYDGGYITPNSLKISEDVFTSTDFSSPLTPSERYDLAISLEVAEHISPSNAETFVNSLISFSDCILFSAAPPYQEGKHHVNEQPPSYWNHLFAKHDYYCLDFLRPLIWNNSDIAFHYRQNILLFVHRKMLAHFHQQGFKAVDTPNFFYHPVLMQRKMQSPRFLAKQLVKQIIPTIIRKIKGKDKTYQL